MEEGVAWIMSHARGASASRVAARHLTGGGGTLRDMLKDACQEWLHLFAEGRAPQFGMEFEKFDVEHLHAQLTVYGPDGLDGERGGVIVDINDVDYRSAEVEFSWGGKHTMEFTMRVMDSDPHKAFKGIVKDYVKWMDRVGP